MAQWQIAKRWMHVSIRKRNDFSGGLNNGQNAFSVSDNNSFDEYGFDTFDFPSLSVGKGWASYGATGSANTNLLANYKNSYLIRSVGTKVQKDDGTGTWTDIGTGLTSAEWDSTNFNKKIIITNGTDNVKYYDGTTFGNLNATDAPKGLYITNNTLRVYIANVGVNTDWVYFSKFLDETNWTDIDSSGFFQYYTPNGGPITALRVYQNLIMVFKQNSFAEVTTTGQLSNKHRLLEISSEVGCVSSKTLIEVRGMLLWLGLTDVWLFTGGQPTPIGQNVKATLDSINTAYYSKCWAGTDGQRYYLGIVTGVNTEPDTLLIYDTVYKKWRIRSIAIGGMRYAATLQNQWYTGTNGGQTFKMNSGTTENGTAIPYMVTSKPFDEGVPESEKEYNEMHVQCYIPPGSTMSVYVSVEDRGTNFTLIDTFTSSAVAQNTNIIVPLDTVPLANWLRYKITGTGPVNIYSVERYGTIQPNQI